MDRRSRPAIPRAPLVLGVAGLVPFVAAAAGSIFVGDAFIATWAFTALAVWASCMLSAFGAAHVGAALRDGGPARAFAIGAATPLLPFVALSFGGPWGLMAMAAGFLALLAYELSAAASYLPAWYKRLKLWLTGAVLFCLIVPIYAWSLQP